MAAMFKLAFSTVCCPEWTLRRVAQAAIESSFEGVELRTFGGGSSHLPSDPALTAPAKTLDFFDDDGVDIAGLAASSRFDAPISPPVLGWVIGDFEKEVREAKRHVDLAEALGAEYVRVFAFEPAPGERASKAVKRIVERLKLLCDHARNRGVRIALENGGGYPRAEQIAEIIDGVGNPLLGACYSVAAGAAAGDDPTIAIDVLSDDLIVGRVKDAKKGEPCLPGDGDVPCAEFTRALGRTSRSGWLVFEWDKLWMPNLLHPEEALPQAADRLGGWLYAERSGAQRTVAAAV